MRLCISIGNHEAFRASHSPFLPQCILEKLYIRQVQYQVCMVSLWDESRPQELFKVHVCHVLRRGLRSWWYREMSASMWPGTLPLTRFRSFWSRFLSSTSVNACTFPSSWMVLKKLECPRVDAPWNHALHPVVDTPLPGIVEFMSDRSLQRFLLYAMLSTDIHAAKRAVHGNISRSKTGSLWKDLIPNLRSCFKSASFFYFHRKRSK